MYVLYVSEESVDTNAPSEKIKEKNIFTESSNKSPTCTTSKKEIEDEEQKMHEIIIRICDRPIYAAIRVIVACVKKRLSWGIKIRQLPN